MPRRTEPICVASESSITFGRGTRYGTQAEAIANLFDYIEQFYNRKRLHSTLTHASPARSLADWFNAQHERQLAA